MPALVDFCTVPSCGQVQLYTTWGGKCLINPWFFHSWCPLVPQYPSPREGATRCAAVRSPLSSCVRAVAKQQPGKVFPGGPTPEVCHSPVASGLWKHLSVGRGAITDTISPLSPCPSRPLVTGCGFSFPFHSSLFLMANGCVLPPLPQSLCALLPQLLGNGWEKSRAIPRIPCSVCRGLSPRASPDLSPSTLSNLPDEIPLRLAWLCSNTFLLWAVKDPGFHSHALSRFILGEPGQLFLHMATHICQLMQESTLHGMGFPSCLSSLLCPSVKAESYHHHLNWITTVSAFYHIISEAQWCGTH